MFWREAVSGIWGRHARWGVLVALAFLCAQWISLQHTAEYGAALHNHNGQICDIAISHDRDGACTLPGTALIEPLPAFSASLLPVQTDPATDGSATPPPARAPPPSHVTA